MAVLLVIPRADDAFIVGEDWLLVGKEGLRVAPWWLSERHPASCSAGNALQRFADLAREKGLGGRTLRVGLERRDGRDT